MTVLSIDNMHCGACIRRVTAALSGVPGTRVDQVSVGMARVESAAPADSLTDALKKAGFPARIEAA